MIIGIIAITAVLAGLIQGITGFGSGIVLMCFLPYLLPISKSAGLVNAITLFLALVMALQYRKATNLRLMGLPTLVYLVGSSLAIKFAPLIDVGLLKIVFALFLLVLAFYFWKYSERIHLRASILTMLSCGFISGVCDGLFAIGGPLMVLFYLAVTKNQEEYMGTIQLTFFVAGLYNLILRFYQGVFAGLNLLPIVCGILGILVGLALGNRLIPHLKVNLVRNLTYALIGFSGLLTILTSLFQ